MAEHPSRKQLEVLEFIASHSRLVGTPPTIREIGRVLEISSTNGVADHLKALERKGYLEHTPSRARTLRLTESGLEVLGLKRCPACGRRAA